MLLGLDKDGNCANKNVGAVVGLVFLNLIAHLLNATQRYTSEYYLCPISNSADLLSRFDYRSVSLEVNDKVKDC